MQVDAHIHFWKYDKAKYPWISNEMKSLQKDYLPEHIMSVFRNNKIDTCVVVQASQTELETHFLVELAKTHPVIKGVVGWIDLQDEKISERLDYFQQYSIIKGWRHVVQSEPGDFLASPGFKRGIAALQSYNHTYDLFITPQQLKQTAELVTAFPEQRFVLDHCGNPGIAHQKLDEWRVLIKELSQHPQVYCKLSGLLTEAKWKAWSVNEFYPYLDTVFENFGTDRLMFGSDWPVILLSGMYVQWKSLLENYMAAYSGEDMEKVFGNNAVQFYDLN
jgi:L-fuconolactonase